MSKTLDALNKKQEKKYNAESFVRDELIKTFFTSSSKKARRRPVPTRLKAPWVAVGLFAAFLAFFIIAQNALSKRSIFFIKDGRLNERLVENISYFGDAGGSLKEDESFILVNSRGVGWANFSLELKKPIDMTRQCISYSARGDVGDERVIIVLIDSENRTYRIKRSPLKPLGREWQDYSVNPIVAKGAVDLSAISKIKFEFGGLTAGNAPRAAIFLKNICIQKREV